MKDEGLNTQIVKSALVVFIVHFPFINLTLPVAI
jgi:hypothetical protein